MATTTKSVDCIGINSKCSILNAEYICCAYIYWDVYWLLYLHCAWYRVPSSNLCGHFNVLNECDLWPISRLFVRDRYRRCSCTDHNTGHAYHCCHTHQLGRYEMRQINGYISPNLCIDLRNGAISAVDGLFMHLSVRCVTWFACIFGLCRIRHFAFKLYKCARIIFMYLSVVRHCVFALNAVAISFPRFHILANCHSFAAASSFVQFSLYLTFFCVCCVKWSSMHLHCTDVSCMYVVVIVAICSQFIASCVYFYLELSHARLRLAHCSLCAHTSTELNSVVCLNQEHFLLCTDCC